MSFAPLRCCDVESVFVRASAFPDGQSTTFMTWWRCSKCQQLSGDMGSVIPVIPSPSDRIDPSTRDAVGTLPADPIAAARDAEKRGLLRRALAILDLAIERTPDDPIAYAVKGRALWRMSFPEHAATLLRRAIELGDAMSATRGWLGLALTDTAEQLQAVPLLQTAIEGELQGGAFWYGWVRLLVRLDRIDEADTALSHALMLELAPRWRAALLTERVNVLCARQQPSAALQAADEALQLAPASPYARYVRGRALGLLGRADEAEAEMDRILRNAPGYGDATRAKQLYAAARQRMQSQDRR
jgi:tetratricopeptide (TPR) repeat protein